MSNFFESRILMSSCFSYIPKRDSSVSQKNHKTRDRKASPGAIKTWISDVPKKLVVLTLYIIFCYTENPLGKMKHPP